MQGLRRLAASLRPGGFRTSSRTRAFASRSEAAGLVGADRAEWELGLSLNPVNQDTLSSLRQRQPRDESYPLRGRVRRHGDALSTEAYRTHAARSTLFR